MSSHTCIILLPKLTKKYKKEERGGTVLVHIRKLDNNNKVDKLHMKTKWPKQLGHFPREEDRQYAPCLEIKLHPKNVAKS
jgi:hypothetical protein